MSDSPADWATFAESFRRVGTPKSMDHLRWQYLSRPGGLQVLVADGDDAADGFAAIYAAFGVSIWLGGSASISAQSVDTLTAEEYRGRGLFTLLATQLIQQLRDEGFALIYGFANGNSIHGAMTKLGYSILDPLPILARPLDAAFLLKRITRLSNSNLSWRLPTPRPRLAPNEEIVPTTAFTDEHEAIWRGLRPGRIGVDRTAEYLQWRLLDKPESNYRVVEMRRGGDLVGWAATTVQEKHDGRIGYLMELLTKEPGGRAERQLLRYVVRDMREQGAQIVLCWNLKHSPNSKTLRREFFLPFPERLRPIELHFAVQPLASDDSEAAVERSRWYLSYLDSDTV